VPEPQCALAFERVSKRFGKGVLALDDVSWSIQHGSRACLLGPNGAGKSTSVRLLEGAVQPTGGRVSLLGAAVNGPDYMAARRQVGVVPQGPGMYADLSVVDYLSLASRLYGRGDVDYWLGALGLEPYRNRALADLSGGYQRRAVIAAALLPSPDLLLLDEPTVALDPVAAHEVHTQLREAMTGRTTLLCTHNLAEAEALCDEVVILRGGKVLVHSSLAELRQRARKQVRFAARQPANRLAESLRRKGLETTIDADLRGVLVPVGDPAADTPPLLRALLAEGLDVYEARPVEATLETLFLDVVRETV
jgi:ABC-2 type transport system ATP-binding protein